MNNRAELLKLYTDIEQLRARLFESEAREMKLKKLIESVKYDLPCECKYSSNCPSCRTDEWLNSLQPLLAEVWSTTKEALEGFDLNPEIHEQYNDCSDKTTYCSWSLGKYRRVKEALGAMKKWESGE